MVLKEMLQRLREKRAAFKEVQTTDRIHTIVSERKKGSNERELEKFVEEERQSRITQQLTAFRKKRADEDRKTTVLDSNNMFTAPSTILNDNKKLFSVRANNLQGGMFFK